MIDNGKWNVDNEYLIDMAEYSLIDMYLREWFSVVVDDTNGKDARVEEIQDAFSQMEYAENVTVVTELIDTPLKTCIERNRKRPKEEKIPTKVIKEMWEKHFRELYKTF